MNKLFRFAVPLAVIIGIFGLASPASVLAANVSVWWPTDNVTVSDVQPFKALVDGSTVETYNMFWQVDNGQLNPMDSNYADYPHKESQVNLNGWNWNSSGSYSVNFVAKDKSGNQIGSKAITIKVPTTGGNVSGGTTSTAPAPATDATVAQTATKEVAAATSTVTQSTSSLKTYEPVSVTQTVLSPSDGSKVTGIIPFKSKINEMNLPSYKMYWQVGSGQLNQMNNDYSDSSKVADVDVSNWNWNGTGPYAITFIAKNLKGREIARKTVNISIGNTSSLPVVTNPVVTNPVTPTTTTPAPNPVQDPVVNVAESGNPLSGMSFYVNPNSNAKRQSDSWKYSRPNDALQMDKIASQPEAKWLGDWNSNIYNDTKSYVDSAAALGKVPVMIAYNIPQRDCGNYSAGGTSVSNYQSWISNIASAIGSRKAVVILEPDALTLTDCLSAADKTTRFNLIKSAVEILKANSNIVVYIDAGHSNWVGASDMASRLKSAGIDKADGFALNVSNYTFTDSNISYGQSVSSQVYGKHFVIDTSRNGAGPNGSEWCNPAGRALGAKVTTNTGNSLVDGLLWLKNPGESDGTCNGGPSAGVWWPEYALGLAQRASY